MPAVIVQPAWAPEKLQLVPGSVGKVSETVTFFATPVPELVTVTVKPICSPALTEAASAVLEIVTSGQFTVIVWGPLEGEPSFVLVTEAVFVTDGQVAAVVDEEMWTDAEAPAARLKLALPQVRT